MKPHGSCLRGWPARLAVTGLLAIVPAAVAHEPSPRPWKTALLAAAQVTDARLAELAHQGFTGVALELRDDQLEAQQAAAAMIRRTGLALDYWIEVARHERLAEAHPQWMASLQGHPEWRRLFPEFPASREGQLVKVFPWVPIGYREAFDAHRDRLIELLKPLPAARQVFLNDLQAAPSACGCGNPLCRWTTDYGPLRTATTLGDDAAARFVAEVARHVPQSQVVPVWVTECEEHDGAADGWCAGVGCFRGICWKASTRQLMPVAALAPQLGVLLTVRELQRELPVFDRKSGWISAALASFQTMPPQRGGRAIAADRLIAVLQGWDATPAALAAEIQLAQEAGVAGLVVAWMRIDQSWQPRLVRLRPAHP